nr:S24 family peptidase [Halomonas desiderata]
MTIGERLKAERERLGLSQTALAQVGGVGKTTQINYEKGARSPDAAYLSALDGAGVDVQFVLTGRREGASQTAVDATSLGDGSRLPTLQGRPGPGLAEVKLYDVEGAAGAGRSLEEERIEGMLYFPEAQLAALGIQPGQVAGIKVRGDSMESTLADGDWVLVDLANRDIRQEGVFLLTVSGERRIKRLQRLAGGALYLISDNEHYQPEMITPQQMGEVEILGRCEIRIGRVT